MRKVNASVKREEDKIVIIANGKEVSRRSVTHKGLYTFHIDGEEYNYIYEGNDKKGHVFFYPPHEFQQTSLRV